MKLPVDEPDSRDRLLVVGASALMADTMRRRYPAYELVCKDGLLSGIAEIGRGPVAAALIHMSPRERRADQAVEGFRTALGDKARLVLCSEPAGEPLVRRSLVCGADDYVIYPPTGEELDRSLGLCPASPGGGSEHSGESVDGSLEMLGLEALLASVKGDARAFAEGAATFVQNALRAECVRVEYGHCRAEVGGTVKDAVLAESFGGEGGARGRILVGERPKTPYGHRDLDRLRIYGRMLGRLFEEIEARGEWQRLALTDDLSGLRNRRYLLQVLAHLLKRAEAERFRLTLLIFDIDDFKRFNDRHGHTVGDELIRETGRLFQTCCRREDVVTRLGGDEFAVVFWDAEGPREAGSRHPADVIGILERFRAALKEQNWHTLGPDAKGCLTISGGLASFPWDARTPGELMARADRALLAAKRQGKNNFQLVGDENPPAGDEGPSPR